ncbi:hypothetical protein SynMVIR181_01039 [Synechococcus sp. MVIR-18-1]|nr:hypothetical protein SynMVIR181_01039 [Synechococcus sp. MVIR-18-1]
MCQVPFCNAIGVLLMTIQAHAERSINADPVRLESLRALACIDMDSLSLPRFLVSLQISPRSEAFVFVKM